MGHARVLPHAGESAIGPEMQSIESRVSEAGTLSLRDGTAVPFRPIEPGDQAALQAFHRRLSDRSVHQRFFCAKPELGERQAYDFTHVDGRDRFALVAVHPLDPGKIIAAVRFDREAEGDRAEYAGVVADEWQGLGLGTALTRRLVAAAVSRGIRRFQAIVLPDNLRMLGLLRDLALPERITFDGGEFEIVEVGPLPGWN
jgi:RimJ/RimL family protein N-acetyltransferase